ncbi:PREDICTED: uncharacterized protein LOC104702538 isoform X2 [Camelina sativa]|uniref:Uncharacterized protein LOC104702538 isoform X2 n=1 Tax=Camelina sativa TaxID=90675 RepID=A0ABM0SVG9_CAMSA|nr:PREDICTED: uncharacterized protein LOC104702538 isoform X2 [Camelina sativa]
MDESNESISANQNVASLDFVVPNHLFNRDDLGTNSVAVERDNQTFGPTPNFILIPESQDEDILCPVNDMGKNSLAVDKEDNIIDDCISNFGVTVDSSPPTGVCEVQPADASLNTDNTVTNNTIEKQ